MKTSYTAKISVNDGENNAEQDITVNINNVNDNSPQFTYPQDCKSPNITYCKGQETSLFVAQIQAEDQDNDDLTFTIEPTGGENDDSDLFQISSDGVLTFKEIPDCEGAYQAYCFNGPWSQDASLLTLQIKVSDGINHDDEFFMLAFSQKMIIPQ